MIKKILVLLVVLLLVVPTGALADSAMPIPDDDQFITVELKIDDYDIQIGEYFYFTVTITNISSEIIESLHLRDIFDGSNINTIDRLSYSFPESINPGEKIDVAFSAIVPQDIIWFKKDDSYYTKLDFIIEYSFWKKNEETGLKKIKLYSNKTKCKKPLKITNLFDDDGTLDMEISSQTEKIYFVDHYYKKSGNDFSGDLNFDISATNRGVKAITNIYAKFTSVLQSDSYFSGDNHTNLSAGSKNIFVTSFGCTGYKEDIQESLNVICLLTYKKDKNYYALQKSLDYKTKLIRFPDFDISTKVDNSDKDNPKKIMTLTNNTKYNYENLYVDYDSMDYDIYSQKSDYITLNKEYLYENANKGSKLEISHIENPEDTGLIIGYICDDIFFGWDPYTYVKEDGTIYFGIIETSFSRKYMFLGDPTPTPIPTSTPSPSPVPTRTPKPTQSPKQTDTASPTLRPTPPPTLSPTPLPTEKPIIEIVDIKKSHSIPFWVWYVLTVAVVVCVVLIITFRKRNKEDKYE